MLKIAPISAAALALLTAGLQPVRADFVPITLTPASYGQDGVIELAAPHVAHMATTATMDGGTANNGYTWYEIGYDQSDPGTGVPAAGSTFTSQAQPDHSFIMPPNYTNNNAVMISSAATTGALVPTTPAAYSGLSFLGSSGGGDVTVNYTVYHADGTTDTGSFVSPDWFGTGTVAYYPLGRVDAVTRSFQTWGSGIPEIFSMDVTLAHTTSPVTNIALSYSSGNGRACLLAVSGYNGTSFNPIVVTGFNQDMVIEATAELPVPFNGAYTTVSMDNGLGNTGFGWYEKGFVMTSPNTGVPNAGATITNSSANDHVYKMAPSYAANDVIYVDTNNPATVTPATPATYSALSFFGASGHGPVVIICQVSHADGSTETGNISVPDWFGSGTTAWPANGRMDVQNDSLQTWGSGGPTLFSMDLALTNTGSAVTNIALTYSPGNTGYPGQALILAVSGAAGAIRPSIAAQPVSTNSYNPGAGVQYTVNALGTAPLSYRWQKVVSGVAANLSDGGNITGSTTSTLTVSPVSGSDGAGYRVIISNAAGSVTSSVAPLNIVSTMHDVTQPGDTIEVYNGSGGSGSEGVASAIDNNSQKYLNVSGPGPGYSGPVGLIVTPNAGSTIIRGMRIYTANDAPGRDPADYVLEGSNDGSTYSTISAGTLALPDDRNIAGLTVDPIALVNQEIDFSNSKPYTTYRLSFPHVKDSTGNNLMQIAEIELLGTPALLIKPAGAGQIELDWTQGTLLEAPSVLGPWTTNTTLLPGGTFTPSGPSKYFKLQVQ